MTGAEGRQVSITSVDGKVLATATAGVRESHTVGVAGVYLVSINGEGVKVIVR